MRKSHKVALAGAVTALLAGAAIAASRDSHVMTVNMPDGGVARIHYFGDTPPKVQLVPASPDRIAFADPFASDAAFSPFAEMERVSAMMDARMNAMMRQAATMQNQTAPVPTDGAPHMVMFSNLPKGAHVQYSYTSTTVDKNGCAQSVSWSSNGTASGQPKMVKTASGSCGTAKDAGEAKPITTSAKAPAQTAKPDTI
jgi:hypothetical protein